MIRIIILLIMWLSLPLVLEFDYRIFNRMTGQNHPRKMYLFASIAEVTAFSGGLILGGVI